jgi:hypothetical protein
MATFDDRANLGPVKRGPEQAHPLKEALGPVMDRRSFLGSLFGIALGGAATTVSSAQEPQPASPDQAKQKQQPTQVAPGLDPKAVADISRINLGAGDFSYRDNGTPVPTTGGVARGPNMTPPAGIVLDAVRRGVESILIANDGKLPPGATFRLVVGIGEKPQEFALDASKLDPAKRLLGPDVRTLQKDPVFAPAYQFLREHSVINVDRSPTGYTTQFALAADHKQPIQILLVMDTPKPAAPAAAPGAPEKK